MPSLVLFVQLCLVSYRSGSCDVVILVPSHLTGGCHIARSCGGARYSWQLDRHIFLAPWGNCGSSILLAHCRHRWSCQLQRLHYASDPSISGQARDRLTLYLLLHDICSFGPSADTTHQPCRLRSDCNMPTDPALQLCSPTSATVLGLLDALE